MPRTKPPKEDKLDILPRPDAILCSDLHLREDVPVCRTDDYFQAQWGKIRWLKRLQLKYDCPILCAGDVFHHWKPSPYLLRMAIEFLPKMLVVAGQHDLPQHNLDLVTKSGLGVLMEAGKVWLLGNVFNDQLETFGFSYGEEFHEAPRMIRSIHKAALTHHMTYLTKPWPDAPPEGNASAVCEGLKGYDLIVTGDNHQSFEYRSQCGQLLVNPGSMMRMTASQEDHQPRVYFWYAGDNRVEPVPFLIQEGVISREHIERTEERDERMEAFVSRLKRDYDEDLSFEENLKKFLQSNKVSKKVETLIWEAVENA